MEQYTYGLDAGQAQEMARKAHTELPEYVLQDVRNGLFLHFSFLEDALQSVEPDVEWTAALLGTGDAHLQGWYPGEQEDGVEEPAWSIALTA